MDERKGGRSESKDAGARPAEDDIARRATPAEIEASLAALTLHPLSQALLDAADVSVLVLNRERQILVGSSRLLSELRLEDIRLLRGARPGEALGCIHANQCAGGCGAAPECSACGTALAILESQRTRQSIERECLMTVRRDGALAALELQVRAAQVEIEGETFTVVGLRDVSAEKRRDALEQLFLHDVGNTVSPLLLSAEMLASRVPEAQRELAERVARLSHVLRRDLEDQRVLIEAEKGTLEVRRAPVQAAAALASALGVLDGAAVARSRAIEVAPGGEPLTLLTDESLLVRVLVNMLKNALEATPPGGAVRASVEERDGSCEFRVWNCGAMPRDVAFRVFKRSFSTKGGRGRGLGTFSIKLLGERYLGGVVGFDSSAATGTTFFIRIPL